VFLLSNSVEKQNKTLPVVKAVLVASQWQRARECFPWTHPLTPSTML